MHDMDCKDIAVLLSGLIDGEVDPATRHEAERHLVECPTCAAKVAEAERLDFLTRAAVDEPSELSDSFVGAVLERTRPAPRASRQSRWITASGWFATAASLALALVLWRGEGRSARPERTTMNPVAATAGWTRESPYRLGPEVGSEIDESPLPAELFRPDGDARGVSRRDDRTGSDGGARAVLVSRDDAVDGPSAVPFSRRETEAMDAGVGVLEMVLAAESPASEMLDRARRVVAYDELIDRLDNLAVPPDSPEAEALDRLRAHLTRLTEERPSEATLRAWQATIERERLAERVGAMTRRWYASHPIW